MHKNILAFVYIHCIRIHVDIACVSTNIHFMHTYKSTSFPYWAYLVVVLIVVVVLVVVAVGSSSGAGSGMVISFVAVAVLVVAVAVVAVVVLYEPSIPCGSQGRGDCLWSAAHTRLQPAGGASQGLQHPHRFHTGIRGLLQARCAAARRRGHRIRERYSRSMWNVL